VPVIEAIRAGRQTFSFEFFPPRTPAGERDLLASLDGLLPLGPTFVSVTRGAGGIGSEATDDLVLRIRSTTGLDVVPHLLSVGRSREHVAGLLRRCVREGVTTVMALRGDDPRTLAGDAPPAGDFRYASDLVREIARFNERLRAGDEDGVALAIAGHGLGIGVAGYPEGHWGTPNRLREMDHLRAKVDAGADFIVTQMFFDNRDFYDFRERCALAGVRVPIIAGIMPITSRATLSRMADIAKGVRFPASLLRAIARAGDDDEAVARVGCHWAAEQCRDLLDRTGREAVAGIHFYTLNRSSATRDIFASLGVKTAAALAG
jgi:methylenetetrahydrofolate reductase (NADPH)